MKNFYNKGFTLLELILVISIFIIIIVVVTPKLVDFKQEQSLKNTTENIIAILNQARADSLSSLNSNNYGVHLTASSVIYFSGSSFDEDDVANVEITIDNGVALDGINLDGGGSDVIFPKLIDDVVGYGSFNLYLISNPSRQKTISISRIGTVSIN